MDAADPMVSALAGAMQARHYGKYRGQVASNADPANRGRLQVSVPALLGDQLVWAMPCAPYAGNGVGLFALPPVGAGVWVEFEGGDPDYPIWSGCFWSDGQAPKLPAEARFKVIKTDACTITITDVPKAGIIEIETALGVKISFSQNGLEITNGKGASIKLTGSQVSINQGALEVT